MDEIQTQISLRQTHSEKHRFYICIHKHYQPTHYDLTKIVLLGSSVAPTLLKKDVYVSVSETNTRNQHRQCPCFIAWKVLVACNYFVITVFNISICMQKKNEITNYIISFQLKNRRKGCNKKEGKTKILKFLFYSIDYEVCFILCH